MRVWNVLHGVTMNPFEVLGAQERFDVDLEILEKTHRELSRALHPDRFAQALPTERRAALEKAANVNEAWRIVRDPIRRAEALFKLAGLPVGETNEPKTSPAFLMEMMEQREELAEARATKDLSKVQKLGRAIEARQVTTLDKLSRGLPGPDTAKLLPLLGELRFYRRFLDEVSAIEDDAMSASSS